jgi:aryl-alcohol dehydrogenase-like predicted oxidoreductase
VPQQSSAFWRVVPLASGLLSGNYTGLSVRTSECGGWQSEQDSLAMIEQVEEVRKEVPDGVAMAHWALAWCLRNPAVSTVIPGNKNIAQVESNALAADLADVSDGHPLATK